MKILFVAPEIRLRGASWSLIGMAEELQRQGHDVTVLVRQKENEYVQELKRREIRVTFCKYFLWVIHGEKNRLKKFCVRGIHRIACYYNRIAARRMRHQVQQYDMIHTNTTATDFGGYLSKYSGVPHVWHVREFGKEDFGFMPVFSDKFTYKFMEKNSNRIILISEALFEKYKSKIKNDKLEVVYNGIDHQRFYKPEKILFSEYPLLKIEMHGYISESKGQDELVEAIHYLKENHDIRMSVKIIGNGDEQYLNSLVKKVHTYGLDQEISFIGFRKDIEFFLEEADISIVSSRAEAFGRVTAEAMMAGMVVIAADSGGSPELLDKGKNGYLYQPGDCNALAEWIQHVYTNRNEAEEIAKRGQNFALQHFTAQINVKNVYKIYENIWIK